jgi:hypothetical protein
LQLARTAIPLETVEQDADFLELLSDAELFANRSALFTNGGEFRYAPL